MMAKKALGVAALALAMVPANATIARLKALGMEEFDNEGSYYISDDRNIFLNVANVNNVGDSVIIEWGSDGQRSAFTGVTSLNGQIRTDEDPNPKAKGGFFKKHGDFTYGVYLGNESNTSALLRILATPDAQITTNGALDGSDNQMDLFFGGKASFANWGVNVVYTKDDFENSATDKGEDQGYAIRGGFDAEKWDAFLNLSLKSEAERTVAAGTYKFDGSLGIHLGGSYDVMPGGKVFAGYKTFKWDQIDTAAVTTEGDFTTYLVGYGMERKSGKGTLYTSVEYRNTEVEVKYATNPTSAKNTTIPLTVAYEYDATSWLTLRGSVRQNVLGTRENNNFGSLNTPSQTIAAAKFGGDTSGQKATLNNTTDVRAGATLNFGNIKIDGLIGVGGNNGQLGASSINENGVFDMDRLLARVGMVYSF